MSGNGLFASFLSKLQKNGVFKFSSSVKLAVPLMLVTITCVAIGTVIESNYNSDYAKLTVYSSWWFLCLMGLLFLNILNAAISRYPFKKHHTGFVITHIGLLTLLTGAMMTSVSGIDGQLQITQGKSNSWIVLPRLMLSYQYESSPSHQAVVFEKTLTERSGSSLSFLNDSFGHLFRVEKMLPFAKVEKIFTAPSSNPKDVAVSFLLRSQFFNVSEWLHSTENPEMQMGPATLRLVVDSEKSGKKILKPTRTKLPPAKAATKSSNQDLLVVSDFKSKKVLKEISIANLLKSPISLNGSRIHLKKAFRHGVVSQNKLIEADGNDGEPNPVLELEIESKGQKIREVLYAKFPSFSLHPEGVAGLAFAFKSSGQPPESAAVAVAEPPSEAEPSGSAPGSREGNTVEFHLNPAEPKKVRIELYKANQPVGSETLEEGQSYQTPWMGMKVFLGTLAWGKTSTQDAVITEPQKGQMLPPSAIYISTLGGDQGFWLMEGEAKNLNLNGRPAQIYFGRETLELPFSVHLDQFRKVDYPGTETPLSFESEVKINNGLAQVISMNEPLRQDGYTLYQASYIMNPGSPPETVLSVNRDPGRPVKYWGSLILSLGIIVFTVMHSGWYRRKFNS
jgi:hypothetical protein